MNRRTLITKLAATLCVLPWIGQLFKRNAVAAPSNPEIAEQRDFRKAWNSPHFSLPYLREHPDDMLSRMTSEISAQVRGFIEECERDGFPIKNFRISWHNIPDSKNNPDGNWGFFRVMATRRVPYKGPQNGNIILTS